MPKLPSLEEIFVQAADINGNRQPEIIASHVIGFSIACIAVFLRFLSRRIAKIKYGADDWLILASLLFTAGVMTCSYFALHFGLGKHSILADPVGFAKTLIAAEAIYNFAMMCIKFSILCLYHRIFFISRPFTIALWAVAIFVFGYSIAQTFAAIFQCVPIQALWDPYTEGRCIRTALAATILAAFNVITDFAILLLPLPLLWKLQQPLKLRIQIMGIFLLGGFVCFASIYRCVVIHTLSTTDPTWSDVPTSVWTMAELGVATVAACLPTFRPLFNRQRRSSSNTSVGTQQNQMAESYTNLRLQKSRSNPRQAPNLADLGVLTAMGDAEAGKRGNVRVDAW